MRRLMLLRHAKTERGSLTGRDHDRSLDESGARDAPIIGRYLQEHDLVPALTLVSSARRTQQTSAHVTAHFPQPAATATLDELYGASATELLALVRAANGHADDQGITSLMIIAHNPGLHEFALDLLSASQRAREPDLSENLPTSGLVVIDFTVNDWNDIGPNRGTLDRFVSPARIRSQRGGENA